jgi:predicted RecB family nuclease
LKLQVKNYTLLLLVVFENKIKLSLKKNEEEIYSEKYLKYFNEFFKYFLDIYILNKLKNNNYFFSM